MRRIFLMGMIIAQSQNIFSQAVNSVLTTGTWYKVAVVSDGIYKITYADLVSLGVPVASIDPHNIRIFGNGGGMLPMQNDIPRPTDLNEVAIKVVGESDGIFDAQDYVLFYGEAQQRWNYDSLAQRFRHSVNVYSDTTYYFLNCDLSTGQRIISEPSVTQSANHTITAFDDYQFHELDSLNFLHGGREWYGEEFTNAFPARNFQLTFPDMDLTTPVKVYTELLGRNLTNGCQFQMITPAGIKLIDIPPTNNSVTADYAKYQRDSTQFLSTSSTFNVSFNLLVADTGDKGWLNWFETYARRNLVMSGSCLFFRDMNSVGNGNISGFDIQNANSDSVWDITSHNNPKEILRVPGASEHRVNTDDLREFVCFDETALPSPYLTGVIPNQNLHAMPLANLLIITPSEFLNAANTLAAHHISYDGLSVNVAEVNQVYNEFSSGSQDITAIHDIISMFYHRSPTAPDTFKYVLLFGDASYDYKYRTPGNTNFVPCFETVSSVNRINSYSSDSYIACMDSSEGENDFMPEVVDVAVGRLPAKNLAEANAMTDKVIHYATNSSISDWRKHCIFSADDEDNNTHLSQAEALYNELDTAYCEYDFEKIYIDAFVQDTVPFGWRYPEVSTLLQKRYDEGFLYSNYTGSTGVNFVTNERIIDQTFIDTLQNLDHLPFLTFFGNDFNSFDEPEDTSGGERFLLNPNGGAIGCFSGTNLAFSGSNFSLNQKFIDYIFDASGELRMGDICMKAKRDYDDRYTRNYVLLGDPAVRLKYPENKIVLTQFNGGQITTDVDTLPLGSTITATGEIQNQQGQLLSTFNGTLKILLLRILPDTTLGNDAMSFVREYDTWNDTLYNGTVNVTSGTFSFSIPIPNSGSQIYRGAKISMYAENGITDATGCHNKMLIGNIFAGVSEMQSGLSELIISPNPASSVVEIKFETTHDYPLKFSLFDQMGRKILSDENVQQNPFHFKCDNLAKGIYFVTMENQEMKMIGKGKLVVR